MQYRLGYGFMMVLSLLALHCRQTPPTAPALSAGTSLPAFVTFYIDKDTDRGYAVGHLVNDRAYSVSVVPKIGVTDSLGSTRWYRVYTGAIGDSLLPGPYPYHVVYVLGGVKQTLDPHQVAFHLTTTEVRRIFDPASQWYWYWWIEVTRVGTPAPTHTPTRHRLMPVATEGVP